MLRKLLTIHRDGPTTPQTIALLVAGAVVLDRITWGTWIWRTPPRP